MTKENLPAAKHHIKQMYQQAQNCFIQLQTLFKQFGLIYVRNMKFHLYKHRCTDQTRQAKIKDFPR